jgi:asparagine synthase (glutamine-hydrolysing)
MAEESSWQETVIKHLRLGDWERAELTDELDLIGGRAQQALRRYGLLLPAPMYHWTLSFDMARGGSHLTGEGGDEMFGLYRARTALASLGSPKRLLHLGPIASFLSDVAPRSARTWWLRRGYLSTSPLPSRPWMRPEAFRRLCDRYAVQEGGEPFSWKRGLFWQLSHRYLAAIKQNGKVIAADYGALHSDPFLEASFVSAFSRSAGIFGFRDRAEAMTFLAGDLLPAGVLRRTTKGGFNRAYFTDVSRAYVETWDGDGIDSRLVDPEALKREWTKPVPSALSTALLQAVWMAQHDVPIAGMDESEATLQVTTPRSPRA